MSQLFVKVAAVTVTRESSESELYYGKNDTMVGCNAKMDAGTLYAP